MGDCHKKEPCAKEPCAKEEKCCAPPDCTGASSRSFRTLLVCGVVLCSACFAWYQARSSQSPDIDDITRPPQGFEIADISDELHAFGTNQDDVLDSHQDASYAPKAYSTPSQGSDVQASEIEQLRERVHQLQQLVEDKDTLIAELNQRVASEKTGEESQENESDSRKSRDSDDSRTGTDEDDDDDDDDDDDEDRSDSDSKTRAEASRSHTVKKGETLSEISRQYYGSSGRWEKILEANKDKISDKNRVRVGTVLVIPE